MRVRPRRRGLIPLRRWSGALGAGRDAGACRSCVGANERGVFFREAVVWLLLAFRGKVADAALEPERKDMRAFDMRKGCILTIVVGMVVGLWAPMAFAAKVALSDNELELLTAAGEPTVVRAFATNGVATFIDEATFTLNIPQGAQQGLRALTVQNVVGEVQLLVNLNVLSASQNVNNTDQRNYSVQSWGSTLPEISATVKGEPLAVVNPECHSDCKSTGLIAGTAVPGQIDIASASADVIVEGGKSAQSYQQPIYTLSFDQDAQVDLAGLFIANIVGRVQAAYNINIAAATLNLIPDPNTPFAVPFQNATGTIKQVNFGMQFRGTPLGAGNTAVVINAPLTPN